jgi:hypothetical protein
MGPCRSGIPEDIQLFFLIQLFQCSVDVLYDTYFALRGTRSYCAAFSFKTTIRGPSSSIIQAPSWPAQRPCFMLHGTGEECGSGHRHGHGWYGSQDRMTKWTEIAVKGDLTSPSPRRYHPANVVGMMAIIGGSNGKDCFSEVWVSTFVRARFC